MGKHKAKFNDRPAAYVKKEVVIARSLFAMAMIDRDFALARTLRMRGRTGTMTREWADRTGPWWNNSSTLGPWYFTTTVVEGQ